MSASVARAESPRDVSTGLDVGPVDSGPGMDAPSVDAGETSDVDTSDAAIVHDVGGASTDAGMDAGSGMVVSNGCSASPRAGSLAPVALIGLSLIAAHRRSRRA